MESKSAALFGPQALAERFLRCLPKGTATYAFNLGLDSWIKHGIYPGFVWITEKKIIQDITGFLNARLQAIPKEENTVFLVPRQFADLTHHFESSRVRFVELEPCPDPHISASLSMQAAAVWQTVSQGYERVDCIGFDHFFARLGAGIIRNGFLPSLPLPAAADTGVQWSSCPDLFTDVYFHTFAPTTPAPPPLSERPSALSTAHFVLPYSAKSTASSNGWTPDATKQTLQPSAQHLTGPSGTTPLVSILTCVKNSKDTIRETLTSIAQQTYANVELIVVDGASTDGTKEVLAEHGNIISRIISEPDSGYYEALNKAVALSGGQYLIAVNGDDVLAADAIEHLVNAATKSGADIVAAHATTVTLENNNGGVLRSFWNASAPVRCQLRHGTMLASRSAYRQVGPYDASHKVIADRLWMAEAFRKGLAVAILDKELMRFRLTGISSRGTPTHLAEIDGQLRRLEPALHEADVLKLRHIWEQNTATIVNICRKYPLAGVLRQALVADRYPELFGGTTPAITFVLRYGGDPEAIKRDAEALLADCDRPCEIILCGEASATERSVAAELAKASLAVHHLPSNELHWCRDALWQASGDYVCVLPDGTRTGKGWSTALRATMGKAMDSTNALVIQTGSSPEILVCGRPDSISCDFDGLLQLLPSGSADGEHPPTLFTREFYKNAANLHEQSGCYSALHGYARSTFLASAFYLPPTRVGKTGFELVEQRIHTLHKGLQAVSRSPCECVCCRVDGVQRFARQASELFCTSLAENPRIGGNMRLRLVTEWNKLYRPLSKELAMCRN